MCDRSHLKHDDHFGLCPICHKTDGMANAGKSHQANCKEHKISWLVGSNLVSNWRDQTEEEQRRVWDAIGLNDFADVEPYFHPGDHADVEARLDDPDWDFSAFTSEQKPKLDNGSWPEHVRTNIVDLNSVRGVSVSPNSKGEMTATYYDIPITNDDLVNAHKSLCLMFDTDDEGWERVRWIAIKAIEAQLGYNPGARNRP